MQKSRPQFKLPLLGKGLLSLLTAMGLASSSFAAQFDAPYQELQKKNAAAWAEEDTAIDAKLAAAGNGVIGRALDSGLPVIHMLNTRELSGRSGIPFDVAPGRKAPLRLNPWWSLVALALFFGVLLAHRRWRLV